MELYNPHGAYEANVGTSLKQVGQGLIEEVEDSCDSRPSVFRNEDLLEARRRNSFSAWDWRC